MEGQGDLVSKLMAPMSHARIPVSPIISSFLLTPLDPPSRFGGWPARLFWRLTLLMPGRVPQVQVEWQVTGPQP